MSTCPDRRELLRLLAGGGLAASVGCAKPEPALKPTQTLVPLDTVSPGARKVITVAGRPVEVVRKGSGLEARSLMCSHTGCVVKWKEDEQVYWCPCHEGRYDADGNVLSGPPPQPLAKVPVVLAGRNAIVGT
jgi:cytochrome b6-f complex iron-sulfur subunit